MWALVIVFLAVTPASATNKVTYTVKSVQTVATFTGGSDHDLRALCGEAFARFQDNAQSAMQIGCIQLNGKHDPAETTVWVNLLKDH